MTRMVKIVTRPKTMVNFIFFPPAGKMAKIIFFPPAGNSGPYGQKNGGGIVVIPPPRALRRAYAVSCRETKNPNPLPTANRFGFLDFVFCCRKRYSPESLAAQRIQGFAQLVFLFFCAFFKPFPNPHIDILTKPCANRIGKKGHASAQPSFLLQSYDLLI